MPDKLTEVNGNSVKTTPVCVNTGKKQNDASYSDKHTQEQ